MELTAADNTKSYVSNSELVLKSLSVLHLQIKIFIWTMFKTVFSHSCSFQTNKNSKDYGVNLMLSFYFLQTLMLTSLTKSPSLLMWRPTTITSPR